MKLKEGFMLREVAGNFVVVPVGSATKEFRGIITLNSTGAFLWRKLVKGATFEQLIQSMVEEYEIDEATASKDINAYIDRLNGAGLIE